MFLNYEVLLNMSQPLPLLAWPRNAANKEAHLYLKKDTTATTATAATTTATTATTAATAAPLALSLRHPH